MDKNPPPPPYPGPAYPPQPVFQAAPAPTVVQQMGQQVVPPPVAMVQQAPPPAYIQSAVQPGVAVIEQVPQPAILQQAAQPNITVVQQAPPATVIQPAVQQPVMVVNTVVAQPRLSEQPAHIRCNLCGQEIVTTIRYINGGLVWGLFTGLCLFGIWPCCLIPFCVNACKDVEHSCPYCHNIISVYKRG